MQNGSGSSGDAVKRKKRWLSSFAPSKRKSNTPHPPEWFSIERIHSNEVQYLPEYFNGSLDDKTPDSYKNLRLDTLKRNSDCQMNTNIPLIQLFIIHVMLTSLTSNLLLTLILSGMRYH